MQNKIESAIFLNADLLCNWKLTMDDGQIMMMHGKTKKKKL